MLRAIDTIEARPLLNVDSSALPNHPPPTKSTISPEAVAAYYLVHHRGVLMHHSGQSLNLQEPYLKLLHKKLERETTSSKGLLVHSGKHLHNSKRNE